MKNNIKERDWVLHPDFPYVPLYVKELRDEEEDGTSTLHVSKAIEGDITFSVLLQDCLKYHKREEEIIEFEIFDGELTEEQVLQNQLISLRKKKNQQEQDDFEKGIYDAYLRVRNSEYIIEKWDHSNGSTLRKISNVRITGVFGSPVEDNYRHVEHNITVNSDVHESIRIFQYADYSTEEEKGYGGVGKTGRVDIDIETFSKVNKREMGGNFIQKGDYPIDKVHYDKAKIFAISRVEQLKEFFTNDFKLEEL